MMSARIVQEGELTEHDLAELIGQDDDDGEGGAQIVDSDGNVVTVCVHHSPFYN